MNMPSPAGRPPLVLVISEYAYFLSHRLPLARAAASEGYPVHVITRVPPGAAAPAPGIRLHPLAVHRSAGNPLREVRLGLALWRLFRGIRPGIVHNVSLRLAPIASLAAMLAGVPRIVNAFTGLGYLYRSRGMRAAMLRGLSSPILRFVAARQTCWSVFQNEDDRDCFLQLRLAVPARTVLIEGSGVDTDVFHPGPEPGGPPVILFAGRILLDKGIEEFVAAAAILAGRGVRARFAVAGSADPHSPGAVPAARLAVLRQARGVEWWGHCDPMSAAYAAAHVVCLPSYHEGLPKVLLEAGACGLPAVATDIPGCRAVINPGENGLLVPCRDASALADAIQNLVQDPGRRAAMGHRARQIVETRFGVSRINPLFLALYSRMKDG